MNEDSHLPTDYLSAYFPKDMNKKLIGALSSITIISIILISGLGTVSAEHEAGHYEFELEEGSYDGYLLSFADDTGVEITLTSNKKIDVLLLTPEMWDACCSGTELQGYEYITDGGSVLNTDEYSFVIENGVGPRYIVFDHTTEPNGGADPSGSVSIELTLNELPENLFEFHWQNLIMSLFFIPISLLIVAESIRPGTISTVLQHPSIINIKKQILKSRMPMTYAFISVNTALFILRAIFSPEEDNILEYVEWGAMASGSVFDGNLFSILTANFFHFDLAHLGGNMFAIYILGRYIEPKFGSIRYLGILLAGGFISSLLSLFYDPYIASGGASGMVFCAFGVVLMEWILDLINSTKHKYCQWHDMQWFWGTMVLNVFISFVPGISLLGHLGGLLGGMGVIFAMVKLSTHPEPRKDQLINCQKCGFSLPIMEISEMMLNNCPKCGQELHLDDYDSLYPGWSKESVQSLFEAGWTKEKLSNYYQEQVDNNTLEINSTQEKHASDSEE